MSETVLRFDHAQHQCTTCKAAQRLTYDDSSTAFMKFLEDARTFVIEHQKHGEVIVTRFDREYTLVPSDSVVIVRQETARRNGIPNESGTHAQIDRECATTWSAEDGTTFSHTDCKLVAFNHHWSVYRINGEPKAIRLDIISRYRESAERASEWIYKPIDETMGPCEVDCPLELLDMVPDPGGYATEWRAKVREHHARRASTKGLRVGDFFTCGMYDGVELQVLRFQGKTPVYLSPKDNRLYTMPRTRITSIRKASFA